ncbi:MAG: class I adenylate-forming enzyme family protein [Hyphomicrobium sp.]
MPLDAVLRMRAERTGSDPFLEFGRAPHKGLTISWSELDERADAAAGVFAMRGISTHDRVGVVLEDTPECLAAIIGLWRLRAVLVPIDRRWGTQTTQTICAHAGMRAIVAAGDFIARLGADLGDALRIDVEEVEGHRGERRQLLSRPEDVAIIAYTSGTTSSPKGVVIRHSQLRWAYSIARRHLFAGEPPRRFGNVFRMGGLGVLGLNYLFPLECGSAVVALPELSIETAATLWRDVDEAQVDFLYLVPTLVQVVVRLSRAVSPSARVDCVTGAAPISPELHDSFHNRFGHRLRNIYGISEASFGVFYGAYDGTDRGAWHLGKPATPITVRLRAPDGGLIEGPGAGELEVNGPVLSDGYWRNEAATHERFVDGWLRTGDVAARDAEGNYTIVGRLKDVVIRGGFNIHLDEVDQTLASHPQVLGACAIGTDTAGVDEGLSALVHTAAGAPVTAGDLADWCRQRLGPAKTPSPIILTHDPLPQNSSGKVVRRDVAALVRALSAPGRGF